MPTNTKEFGLTAWQDSYSTFDSKCKNQNRLLVHRNVLGQKVHPGFLSSQLLLLLLFTLFSTAAYSLKGLLWGINYLCFRYDGAILRWTSVKCRQRGSNNDRAGSDEATQVTARNVILLLKQPEITWDSYCVIGKQWLELVTSSGVSQSHSVYVMKNNQAKMKLVF